MTARMKRRFILPLGLVLAAGLLFFAVSSLTADNGSKPEPQSQAPQGPPAPALQITKVEVLKLAPRPLTDHASFVGHVEPWARVTLSTEIGGVVAKAPIKVGDRVSKDEKLVEMDLRQLTLTNRLNKSNFELALSDYQREKALFDKGLSTPAKLTSLKNRLEVSKLQWELSQLNLERSHILAPFSGVLTKKFVEEGEFVGNGKQLVELVDLAKVKAVINIPEKEIRYAGKGKEVLVTFPALPGKTYKGKVETIGVEADMRSRSFEVEILVDNQQGEIRPGMQAKVKMQTQALEGQILIPRDAIQQEERGSFVYLTQGDKVVKRVVETGVGQGEWVQIVDGLKAGEFLIVTGQQLVVPEEKVVIFKTTEQQDQNS